MLPQEVWISESRCIIQYGEATEYVRRVGRTARLGERGDSLLFLQPIEIDYLKELEKHGVSLAEYPLLKVLDSFPLYGHQHVRKYVSIDAHPWVLTLQKALESFKRSVCIYVEKLPNALLYQNWDGFTPWLL